ncbi:MAG: hypothetical protein HQ402_00995 [Parcubacteria group bacterium]|nr:hypothetical protein [Parcubacteria group bacterium]
MSTIIGADAAKLAGLQIDTLQKVRSGQITLGQWERFNNLSADDREARFGDRKKPEQTAPAQPTEKFGILADLGIITVPADYDHATALAALRKEDRDKFYGYNEASDDQNFSNPSHILKPGDKFRVHVCNQIVPGTTTSEERMAFLATHRGVYVGAQGLSIVFKEKRDLLPKGKWHASFDEVDRPPVVDGYPWVPYVCADSDGDFRWGLGCFEGVWYGSDTFLLFRDDLSLGA